MLSVYNTTYSPRKVLQAVAFLSASFKCTQNPYACKRSAARLRPNTQIFSKDEQKETKWKRDYIDNFCNLIDKKHYEKKKLYRKRVTESMDKFFFRKRFQNTMESSVFL